MLKKALVLMAGVAMVGLSACSDSKTPDPASEASEDQSNIEMFVAQNIITLDIELPRAEAVVVRDGKIIGVGSRKELQKRFKNARLNEEFKSKTIVPGLIDPHVHMILGAMMYAKPFAPPWDVDTPSGIVKGLPDRASFLARLNEINAEVSGTEPLVIYGYHNLVHGALDKHDLDKITTDRPLIIWHYSGHDFYLNKAALDFVGVDASWAKDFIGVPLDTDGEPTGRVYEDAVFRFLTKAGALFLAPQDIERGFNGFEDMLVRSGVTTVAEMGYGLFGLKLEDQYYKAFLGADAKTHVYLVPEHRAFDHGFGKMRIAEMNKRIEASAQAWPRVLPQVKLFTDAAFYSQTMRLRDPGYTGGQSAGEHGQWVMGPDVLKGIMQPYWQEGFDIHIHSNGDAAQDATLAALEAVKQQGSREGQRLVIEHAGLVRPEQIAKAASLGVGLSVASHYVYYMGKDYESAIGERVKYMTPLASSFGAGMPTTMHSDAPLAPPSPLTAAGVHMTRATRQGGVSTPSEKLTAAQALRAVTLDAAWSLGLEDEIGSLEVGKRADFTVLDQNPLDTPAQDWDDIPVWGVVLDGHIHPIEE
jgi:predicted amidohydrolase YtcJ